MSPLKTAALVAPMVALATLATLFFLNRSRVREADSLRYENNQLRRSAYERLHGAMVAAKPSESAAIVALSAPPAIAQRPAPASPVPLYRDEGNATPLAALQTFAWACDRGDATAVMRLLHVDPAARPKAEAYLASLPEPVRSRWKSVDEMAATLLTADTMEHPFPAADILATATIDPVSPDRVIVRLPGTPKDGLEYQRTAAGWCYVVTEAAVKTYLAKHH